MLSLFPDLLTYAMFAPLLLRATAGFVFVLFGIRTVSAVRSALEIRASVRTGLYLFGIGKIGVGMFLCLGLYTQAAALVGFALSTPTGVLTGQRVGVHERIVEVLLAVICLALVMLGPGSFAIDLPL